MEKEILNECLERMKILKLSNGCINAFKRGEVWESESLGALYELNDKEKEIVKEFENEHNGYRVYHLIHNYTDFGELYNIFYVGTDKDEWEDDKEDLQNDYAFVYVKNMDDDFCSEFGSIAIRRNIGGLVRIG